MEETTGDWEQLLLKPEEEDQCWEEVQLGIPQEEPGQTEDKEQKFAVNLREGRNWERKGRQYPEEESDESKKALGTRARRARQIRSLSAPGRLCGNPTPDGGKSAIQGPAASTTARSSPKKHFADVLSHSPSAVSLENAYSEWINCMTPDTLGNLPLHIAVLKGDMKEVRRQCFLLSAHQKSIDVKNATGTSALHLAILCEHVAAVQVLLERGAQASCCTAAGDNCLHLAASQCQSTVCFQALIDSLPYGDPLLNNTNMSGLAPVHMCASMNRELPLIALVAKGAHINNHELHTGCIPLHMAILSKNMHLAWVLLKLGADMYIANFVGKTSRMLFMEIYPRGLPFSATKKDVKLQIFHVEQLNEWFIFEIPISIVLTVSGGTAHLADILASEEAIGLPETVGASAELFNKLSLI